MIGSAIRESMVKFSLQRSLFQLVCSGVVGQSYGYFDATHFLFRLDSFSSVW
jgi:hypothetical protein